MFFTIAGSGDEQNKKTNMFPNSTSLKLSFALCHGILLKPVPEIAVFWDHPIVHTCNAYDNNIHKIYCSKFAKKFAHLNHKILTLN